MASIHAYRENVIWTSSGRRYVFNFCGSFFYVCVLWNPFWRRCCPDHRPTRGTFERCECRYRRNLRCDLAAAVRPFPLRSSRLEHHSDQLRRGFSPAPRLDPRLFYARASTAYGAPVGARLRSAPKSKHPRCAGAILCRRRCHGSKR